MTERLSGSAISRRYAGSLSCRPVGKRDASNEPGLALKFSGLLDGKVDYDDEAEIQIKFEVL